LQDKGPLGAGLDIPVLGGSSGMVPLKKIRSFVTSSDGTT